MLRQGPIPRFAHGVLEYVAGALFVVAPFLLGFDSDTATAVSIVIGVCLLFVAATTDGPSSMVNSIPLGLHVLLDYALAALLIAGPFLFSFADEAAPTAFFIVLGITHLMVTVGTRFRAAKG